METTEFIGKVALVTGGSRGIGRETAQLLAAAGATVVSASRHAAEGTEGDGAGSIVSLPADVADPEDVARLVAETMRRFGRIDVLVNNAGGVPHFGPLLSATLAEWDDTFAINLRSMFTTTKAVFDAWMGAHGGVVVNVATIGGIRAGGPALGIYGVAKAGVIMFTKQLARELGPSGVRVNAVAPGLIQTAFSEVLWSNEAILTPLLRANPSGRIGTASEVAHAITYLASPRADYVNGAVLAVDGGQIT